MIISLLRDDQDEPNIIAALIMIISILLLCVALEDRIQIKRKSLIAQTYQIFILSWPCQLIVEIVLERILHLQWWIILPVVFFVGVIGPLLLIKVIDSFERKTNTHILSIIIGK